MNQSTSEWKYDQRIWLDLLSGCEQSRTRPERSSSFGRNDPDRCCIRSPVSQSASPYYKYHSYPQDDNVPPIPAMIDPCHVEKSPQVRRWAHEEPPLKVLKTAHDIPK